MEDLRALVSGFSLSRARLAAAASVSEAAIKKLTKKELAPSLTAENNIDLSLAFGIMLGLDEYGNPLGKNRTKTASPEEFACNLLRERFLAEFANTADPVGVIELLSSLVMLYTPLEQTVENPLQSLKPLTFSVHKLALSSKHQKQNLIPRTLFVYIENHPLGL